MTKRLLHGLQPDRFPPNGLNTTPAPLPRRFRIVLAMTRHWHGTLMLVAIFVAVVLGWYAGRH